MKNKHLQALLATFDPEMEVRISTDSLEHWHAETQLDWSVVETEVLSVAPFGREYGREYLFIFLEPRDPKEMGLPG